MSQLSDHVLRPLDGIVVGVIRFDPSTGCRTKNITQHIVYTTLLIDVNSLVMYLGSVTWLRTKKIHLEFMFILQLYSF